MKKFVFKPMFKDKTTWWYVSRYYKSFISG